MIKNYFTTALRHLLKNKGTAFINITGLALGIASLLVILVVVRYELSFDRFHSDAARIYRVVGSGIVNGEMQYGAGIVYPLAGAIKSSLTAVREVTAMQYEGGRQISVYDEQTGEILRQFQEDGGFVYADSAFFNVFDFKGAGFRWIAGNPETALKEPFTLVLTESLANKYFPEGDALGKTVKINNQVDYEVTGVVSDFPPNTDFPFRMLASYENLKGRFSDFNSDWRSIGPHYCYVVLREGANPEEAEKQILAIHKAHVDYDMSSNVYELQPLREVHTDTRYGNFTNRTVSWEIIGALLTIGLFLIITAVINFINLTTAHAVIRTKEVCVRKVMGSGRKQLITQFLGETFIITSLAGMLALGAAELAMLYGGELLQVTLEKTLTADPFIWLALMLIIMAVTLLAGIYPALVMSRFHPVAVIRNKVNFGLKRGVRLRWGLVTLQFVIAQVFIIGTIIVIKQMEYFRSADLGFEQEAIVVVRLPENQESTLQTVRNQWAAIPQVDDISMASTLPSGESRWANWQDIRRKGAPEEEGIIFERQVIDEHYLDLYQIPLLAGRNFMPTDTLQSVIINRNLAEKAGFATPDEAIGETMLNFDRELTVVGVVENFHTKSFREEIDYVAFVMDPRRYYFASIKLNMGGTDRANTIGQLQETLQQIERIWTATYPAYVFDYQFIDENVAAFYREEIRLSQLFKILAGITIFIGCLGLYGLVAFMAVRRTKEVGIRKVLGASVQHILVLFSKEFVGLVLLAFCIAGPVAYFTMQQWLENFVYRIDIGVGVFVGAVLASLLIALLTVSYESLKAALANPVESLRNE